MYTTKKFVELPETLLLPVCMYKTSPFYCLREPIEGAAYPHLANKFKDNGNCPTTSFTELENKQHTVLQKLNDFKCKLDALMGNKIAFQHDVDRNQSTPNLQQKSVVCNVVIGANPSHPPYSLLLLKKFLKGCGLSVHSSCSLHSSLTNVNKNLFNLFNDEDVSRVSAAISFHIQWKDQPYTSLMVNPLCQSAIVGEVNVIRYISRLFPTASKFNYEAQGSFSIISETDFWLDSLQKQLLEGSNQDAHSFLALLNSRLGKVAWIDVTDCGISDVFACSILLQLNLNKNLPPDVESWFKKMSNFIQISEVSGKEPFVVKEGNKPDNIFDRAKLESLLKELKINYQIRDHPEAFTVQDLLTHVSDMPGLHMKNLFLKDKKKNLYLLCARHDAQVNLTSLGKEIGAKDLRFGFENTLYDILNVKQGCVTIFSLLNDTNHQVKLLLDAEAMDYKHPFVNFHPMTNSATLGISPGHLKVFLNKSGHKPTLINLH